jgi:hypothetical protein
MSDNDFMSNFLRQAYARELVELPDMGVQYMVDHELDQSVVADLVLTVMECGGLHWTELFRFVIREKQRNRVLDAIIRMMDMGIVIEHGYYLSLRPETAALQLAMDFCGIYTLGIPGIVYPDGLITMNEAGRQAVEQIGAEGVAELVMAGVTYPDSMDRMQ